MKAKNHGNNVLENVIPIVPSALSIRDDSKQEIFKIKYDGTVFWMCDGRLTEAKCDKDLSQAFSICVLSLAGFSCAEIVKKIENDAIEKYKKEQSDNTYKNDH